MFTLHLPFLCLWGHIYDINDSSANMCEPDGSTCLKTQDEIVCTCLQIYHSGDPWHLYYQTVIHSVSRSWCLLWLTWAPRYTCAYQVTAVNTFQLLNGIDFLRRHCSNRTRTCWKWRRCSPDSVLCLNRAWAWCLPLCTTFYHTCAASCQTRERRKGRNSGDGSMKEGMKHVYPTASVWKFTFQFRLIGWSPFCQASCNRSLMIAADKILFFFHIHTFDCDEKNLLWSLRSVQLNSESTIQIQKTFQGTMLLLCLFPPG